MKNYMSKIMPSLRLGTREAFLGTFRAAMEGKAVFFFKVLQATNAALKPSQYLLHSGVGGLNFSSSKKKAYP